jgi:photosystem II stability/assembly factor-like uncharacterized protein
MFRLLLSTLLLASCAFADCNIRWEHIPGPPGGEVQRLARSADGTLYAGLHVGGVYRSTNNGGTWERAWISQRRQGRYTREGDIRALGVVENDLFAGDWFEPHPFMVSYTRGSKWSNAFTDNCVPNTLTVAPDSALLLGCENGGIFRSTDRGGSWKHIGLAAQPIASIAVRRDGAIAAAGVGGTLFISRNNGRAWEPHPLSNRLYEVSWTARGSLLVASMHDGVLRSSNEGRTWDRVLASDSMALMVASTGSKCYAGVIDAGLFVSMNDGETWQSLPNRGPHPDVTCLLAIDSLELFAGTSSAGVFHSMDGGLTWKQSSEGMWEFGGSYWSGYLWSSLVCTSKGTLLVSDGRAGIWRSTDHGRHWNTVRSWYAEWSGKDITEVLPLGMFATDRRSIIRSTDDGATWNEAWNTNMLDSGCTLYAGERGALYAATPMGLWRTIDGAKFQRIDVRESRLHTVYVVSSTGAVLRFHYDSTTSECSIDHCRSWKQITIPSGRLRDLGLFSKSDFMMITTAGSFVSSDNGSTWRPLQMPRGSLNALSSAGRRTESMVVFSMSEMLGMGLSPNLLEYTNDSGASWQPCDEGLETSVAHRMIMTTWGEPIVSTWGGLYRGIWQSSEKGK